MVPILFIYIPEQMPKLGALEVLPKLHNHLDMIGFALFTPAIVQLLLALQFGEAEFGWASSQVIGLFCGAAANFVVWLVWNYHKKDEALLPVSLVRRRVIWTGALYHALLMATLFGAIYYLPIYFQGVRGMSAVMSGVSLLPTILVQMLVAITTGFLGKSFCNLSFAYSTRDREPKRGQVMLTYHFLFHSIVPRVGIAPPFALTAGALTSIANGLFSLFGPHSSSGETIGFQVIMGAGLGTGVQMVSFTAIRYRNLRYARTMQRFG